MTNNLLDEYHQWTPGSKIELINGKLYIGDSLTHSFRLLSQILQGWGISAVISLAPENLWWQALADTFETPLLKNWQNTNENKLKNWANQVQFNPEKPPHYGEWNWGYSQVRQDLRMALFSILNRSPIQGESLGGGFVNRLGNNGLMPDILAFRGQPRNQLYEYYLQGSADLLIEFIQPGCEDYFSQLKIPLYQQEKVPELWLINPAQKQIEFLRWIDGKYQSQDYDSVSGYSLSTFPELTFFPELLFAEQKKTFIEERLFKINTHNFKSNKIETVENGVDLSRVFLPFPINLDPVKIAFEDYIYWCPEPKFEFINGRPYIGSKQGIKGLIGLLLMTFGLRKAVKLAHPQNWINALLKQREIANNPHSKTEIWNLTHQVATFLKNHYSFQKIAVAGDLVNNSSFTFWSELILVIWGVKSEHKNYTSLDNIVQQLSEDIPIRLIKADQQLTAAESQVISQGVVEI